MEAKQRLDWAAKKLTSAIPKDVVKVVCEHLDLDDLDDFPVNAAFAITDLIEANLRKKLKRHNKNLKKQTKALRDRAVLANETIVSKEIQNTDLRKRIKTLETSQTSPEGNDETQVGPQDPLLVFPEEIWRIILSKLSKPSNLRSVAKVCQLFENMLKPRRAEMLFGPAIPLIYNMLTRDDILQLRLVNRGWCIAIDEFLEDHPTRRPCKKGNGKYLGPVWMLQLSDYVFTNTTEISLRNNGFKEAMEKSNRNPFIGRNFKLVEVLEDIYAPNEIVKSTIFWREVYAFLEVFGKHIYYFDFYSEFGRGLDDEKLQTAPGTSDGQGRKIIQFLTVDVFQLCPNLRKIGIGGLIYTTEVIGNVDFVSTMGLESIAIDKLISSLTNFVLLPFMNSYSGRIKKLNVTGGQWMILSGLGWDALSELYIGKISTSYQLEHLTDLNLPTLEKLGLEFTNVYMPEALAFVLKIVNNVCSCSNLSVLRISGLKPFNDQSLSYVPADSCGPPKLTTLEIGHDPLKLSCEQQSFSFLLRFPFLKRLHLFYMPANLQIEESNEMGSGRESNFQFRNLYTAKGIRELNGLENIIIIREAICRGRIKDSSMWDILPLLQVFTHNGKVYTRGECRQ